MSLPEQNEYISARDDRDYLLEYKSIDISRLSRLTLLDVPVDNVSRDEAVACILDLIEKKQGPHHVLFIDPIKLMRIRPGKKLRFIAEQARLILADGAGIVWASEKTVAPLKERIPMISFIMDIVRLATSKQLTIYLLGSRTDHLEKVFFNLQRSFNGIRIIGRQGGHFEENREALVKEALRKSAPDIILLGMGFPQQEIWIKNNWAYLSQSIVIGVDGAFDQLSGEEKKAPDWWQLRGLAWLWRTISRPWLAGRFWATIHFVLLVWWRSFKARKRQR
ncbi:MAG: WecB/TagA/CpsF family glycosyltransferase [Spirochaetales bacterium]|nr:WecB/TagA/CpsF family glycosyltransferase [Spirochaetales bacterium]